jgi:uncharacterized protein YgbK (DUF1537 family)
MHEILFKSLLSGLPPEPESVLGEIQARVSASHRKVVVLDDDPTGTQSVHGVSILNEWSVPILQAELKLDPPAFYILTNSRSLKSEAAQRLNREIGANLKIAAQQTGREFVVISRSDSTLRGYYPAETDALSEGLEARFDGVIIAPYFGEGGRYTINDIHYVVSGGKALPAGETEFARDPVFGYSASNLHFWVQEKTMGKIPADKVATLSVQEIRTGDILSKLLRLRDGQVCIVNAVCDADIERVALGLLDAEERGKRYLYRTASSFVRVRAGIAPRPLLTSTEMYTGTKSGGLVVVGSFVPKTNAQLAVLRKRFAFNEIEVNVNTLLDNSQRTLVVSNAQKMVNQSVSAGRDVLLFTSRTLVIGASAQASLEIEDIVSESLVSCVRGLRTRPRYLVAKGGSTSSNVATKGLDVRKALVLGQIIPGVPVWQLGAESRFPGMLYVVFHGNVGDENALADAVSKF